MEMIELTPQLLAALPIERFGMLVRLLLAALPLLAAFGLVILLLGCGGGWLLALALRKMGAVDR